MTGLNRLYIVQFGRYPEAHRLVGLAEILDGDSQWARHTQTTIDSAKDVPISHHARHSFPVG